MKQQKVSNNDVFFQFVKDHTPIEVLGGPKTIQSVKDKYENITVEEKMGQQLQHYLSLDDEGRTALLTVWAVLVGIFSAINPATINLVLGSAALHGEAIMKSAEKIVQEKTGLPLDQYVHQVEADQPFVVPGPKTAQ